MSATSTPAPLSEPVSLVPYDGEALLFDPFYNSITANGYLERLLAEIPWRQDSMKMYGKEIPLPRLTASFGEKYIYSGIQHPPSPIPELLLVIMRDIEQVSGDTFSYCPAAMESPLTVVRGIRWQ